MTDMEFVEKVIDGLIDDYENQKNDSENDALDVFLLFAKLFA